MVFNLFANLLQNSHFYILLYYLFTYGDNVTWNKV